MTIYKTTNLVNGKIYIGQTKSKSKYYIGSGKILRLAIKKYGAGKFRREIICECKSQDELDEREQYWIAHYNSTDSDIGYNIQLGGNSKGKWTNESKLKLSTSAKAAQLKKYKDPIHYDKMKLVREEWLSRPSVRKKLSDAAKGTKNKNYKGKIYCYDATGHLVYEFLFYKDCILELNIPPRQLIRCLKTGLSIPENVSKKNKKYIGWRFTRND